MQVTTTLKNLSTLFAKMGDSKNDYRYVFVKDGVGNVTDGKILFRFSVQAPNGRYDINEFGALEPTKKSPLEDSFGTRMDFPFDPELKRLPPDIKPFCIIDPNSVYSFFEILQAAKKKEENIYFEKTGMGLKRSGDFYIYYPFNVPYRLEFDPFYLHLAFTESLRYPSIGLYQEIRHEHGEEPTTPLAIAYNWENCSLIVPRFDPYRKYYS